MKKFGILFGIIIVAYVAIIIFMSPSDDGDEKALLHYLQDNHASSEQRDAYFFAMQHPNVLKAIPCYCGCARQGHKSNYNCFMKSKEKSLDATEFDSHGLVCPMCVKIALRAKELNSEHKSLKEIRTDVDGMFKHNPNLMPTPTPMPAG